jgi:superfamily II DNA/RNA helicase
VIHYDLPSSIESYVQEIGRAGRDGKLARCHLFLNNDDFYQLRRLVLKDILDSSNALSLTNKIIVEAKNVFLQKINPTLMKSKKRKLKKSKESLEGDSLMEEFEHENELKKFYSKGETTPKKI